MGQAIPTPELSPPGMTKPSRRTIDLIQMKERMTFTKYSAETNGSSTEFESTLAPGHVNPEHYMAYTRATLTGQSGVVNGIVDGKELKLGPGETFVINAGQRYSLRNESSTEDAQMKVLMEPGIENFERAMYCLHGLASDGKTGGDGMPSSFVQLAVIVGMMDVTLTSWSFWLAKPLLAVARTYGQARGVQAELLEKYWKV